MGRRRGEKKRLFLSGNRKKGSNITMYNRCRKADLPYLSKSLTQIDEPCYSKRADVPVVELGTHSSYDPITSERMEIEYDDYLTELESPNKNPYEISGRRIVQLQAFLENLKSICEHGDCGCTIRNLEVVAENRLGLNSIITFKCNFCNETLKMSTNQEENTMDINTAAVEGIMSIGCGYYNLEELMSSMEIPCMDEKTYKKHHEIACTAWEKAAKEEMEEAACKEKEIALEKGNIDEDGIPCITVVADGCWSKRSYKMNYNALSGAASIIGFETGLVLYLGVKNKYCAICIKSMENNEEIKEHMCFRNFQGTSTSMEAAIIVEGFQRSVEMYGLKYTQIIADGDSSTQKKLIDARPYKNKTIEKIECRNHLLRNLCNKLKSLASDTRFPLKFRKHLNVGKILRLRTAVKYAIKYRKTTTDSLSKQIELLKKDIENSIFHVFGCHEYCADYFCKKNKIEDNIMDFLKTAPEFYNRLSIIIKQLSQHSRSLIYDVDSNVVEQLNSKVAKYVGGKRINYSKGRSYQSRCFLAALTHNSKKPHYRFHKTLVGRSPSKFKTNFERKREIKSKRQLFSKTKKAKPISQHKSNDGDPDYGINCQQPDMEPALFEEQKSVFLKKLERSESEKAVLERETRLQAGSSKWLEVRRNLLTASNFHTICKRRSTTSCVNLVKTLLYSSSQILENVPSLKHGRNNEDVARHQLSQQLDSTIEKCGIFIDKTFPFLGASPDGLIGDDILVEIKCPFSANNMPVDEAILKKLITFWTTSFEINTKHSWYYQIQGQLRITGRKECILGVWTSEKEPVKVAHITRDDEFWKNQMEGKLREFYINCMLPEIVDPRKTRNMEIRNPDYILKAIKEKTQKG